MKTLISKPWLDYELRDSGEEEKLERWGKHVLIRPEPKAIWNKSNRSLWNADARYVRNSEGGGRWENDKKLPAEWTVNYKDLKFLVRPTGFKHTGLFPEQQPVWDWLSDTIKSAKRPVKVLNLFAYTGTNTVACLKAGAEVTHLDSAREILDWARQNAELSGVQEKPVRWIPEDAIRYVKREIQRGVKYDGIIMDPPKFGRGTRGEVWKIEQDLPVLLDLCKQVLTPNPLFFFMNAYAVSYSSITLENLLQDTIKAKGSIESGELAIEQTSGRLLPCSIYARWTSQ